MIKKLIIYAVIGLLTGNTFAQQDYVYTRPGWFTFLKNIPGDMRDYTRDPLTKKNLWGLTAITVSTGLMVYYDDKLLNASNELSDKLGLSEQTNWRMEHIGDGYLQLYVASSLIGYGLYYNDNRALQSASQIFESVFASGTIVQLIKHITGRESPFVATTPTGRWRFFPNQIDYHNRVPEFDAFPSGHISSITAMVVVLSENYPEYTFIKPLGYLAVGLNAIGMMNTGVHWISDYPIGIALGYSFAKIAVKRGRTQIKTSLKTPPSFSIYPLFVSKDGFGIHMSLTL
jgi:membrane-associated PAP2 superfamily phosphatase|tara:strand:- start:694 stop:1554 length:861 start_codon:yes stop_codon:yes gene_type:complete